MKKHIIIIFITAGLLAVTTKATGGLLERIKTRRQKGQIETTTAKTSRQEFFLRHQGLKRRYLVYMPPNFPKENPFPVILALHGGGGSADGSPGYFQLEQKADQEGFMVVYPEGWGRRVVGKHFGSWNAGRCCPPAMDKKIDDVGFIKEIIAKLSADFNIDERRIYALGMSNGAQMVYRLACELSDKIAAIAPVGAQGTFHDCQPSNPVSVLHIHGLLDKCSTPFGGTCGGCFAQSINENLGATLPVYTWDCLPIEEDIQQWVKMNGCSGVPTTSYQKESAICRTYQECRDDSEVTLCTIANMGHTWPGIFYDPPSCQRQPKGKMCKKWHEKVGPGSADLKANDMIWGFLSKHSR